MPILLHGTTRQRALKIMQAGPDPNFREPNGADVADGFSTCFEQGPFPLGRPEAYACGKAAQFKEESGPALLAVDVPDEIIDLAKDALFPRSQGIVQFDIQ